MSQPHGGETVRTMIIDDIHNALDEGRVGHAAELFMALRHFLDHHPEGCVGLAAEKIAPGGEPRMGLLYRRMTFLNVDPDEREAQMLYCSMNFKSDAACAKARTDVPRTLRAPLRYIGENIARTRRC